MKSLENCLKFDIPIDQNKLDVLTYLNNFFTEIKQLEVVDFTKITYGKVLNLCEKLEGKEGYVIVHPNHQYNPKGRNSNLIKVKQRLTNYFICIDVVEGKGKYKGVIGALKFQLNGREFSVGSGLTDLDRAENPDYFIGKFIVISYESIGVNGVPIQPTIKKVVQ